MTKNYTLKAAFAHFDTTLANPRQSWSARSKDGKTVVITLWQDILKTSTKPYVYNTFGKEADFIEDSFGNRERIENLVWARDHCDGLFRVVITVAKDVKAKKREIAEPFPQDKLIMRLIEVNEKSGEFHAVMDLPIEKSESS